MRAEGSHILRATPAARCPGAAWGCFIPLTSNQEDPSQASWPQRRSQAQGRPHFSPSPQAGALRPWHPSRSTQAGALTPWHSGHTTRAVLLQLGHSSRAARARARPRRRRKLRSHPEERNASQRREAFGTGIRPSRRHSTPVFPGRRTRTRCTPQEHENGASMLRMLVLAPAVVTQRPVRGVSRHEAMPVHHLTMLRTHHVQDGCGMVLRHHRCNEEDRSERPRCRASSASHDSLVHLRFVSL